MAATKATGVPCYDKAANDEPLFVLCGGDPSAPAGIRAWADDAEKKGHRPEKVAGARQDAEDVEAWQKANPDRVRTPS